MKQIAEAFLHYIEVTIQNSNPIIAFIFGSGVIILESIIPILPLALFIALNMIAFGPFWGFIISWISTIIGCIISFTIFRKGLNKFFYKRFGHMKVSKKLINKIDKMDFATLVVVTALPFTPAFTINIAAGLSHMSYKKFMAAMVLAKISIVYFWGYIGTSLFESITDIGVLVKITIMLLMSYMFSTLVKRKVNLE